MRLESLFRPGVFSINPEATLLEAAEEMRAHDIGSLAVITDGRLVGIVTERDLVGALSEGAEPATVLVSRYMTEDPILASPDDGTEEVAARMVVMGVRHLPVLDNGRVVGMVSIRDLLEATAIHGG
jgi:CBS domain-containing protein